MSNPSKRFAEITEPKIDEKRRLLTPSNTQRCDRKAYRALKAFLLQKECNDEPLEMSPNILAQKLSEFWLALRTEKGDFYKSNSLDNIR